MKPDSWPSLESSLGKASAQTLEDTKKYAEKALLRGYNRDSWSPDGVKATDAVIHAVRAVLNHAHPLKAIEGLGTNVEDTLGAATKEGTDSDTKQTIFVPPPPPSVSPPASLSLSPPPQPEAGPDLRPQKRRKLSGEQYVDLTGDLSPEEEDQLRQSSLGSVDERAQHIISQLTEDDKLNDDTIDIISKALELNLPSSKSAIKILDTMKFRVDENRIPSKLKNDPNPDEDMYAPLHHSSPRHWTLCVLSFESNYKVDSESESGFKCIRLDFYDSLEDAHRLEKVESFFQQWIEKHYPECRIRFNRQVCD